MTQQPAKTVLLPAKNSDVIPASDETTALLGDICLLIESARGRVAVAVKSESVSEKTSSVRNALTTENR